MDPKLYIWDTELDTIQFFDFETGRGEQDDDVDIGDEDDNELSDVDRCVQLLQLQPKLLLLVLLKFSSADKYNITISGNSMHIKVVIF